MKYLSKWSISVLAICLLLTNSTPAATIRANPDGSADATSVLEGISLTGPGDTLLLGPGEYNESQGIILNQSIYITSELGPEVTVVRHVGNPYELAGCVFSIRSNDVSIIGLTITGGLPSPPFLNRYGSGIRVHGDNVLIEHNIIVDNRARDGGGIYISGCSPTIRNNLIIQNDASFSGAIEMLNSSPIIENNTMALNSGNSIAALRVLGDDSAPTIRNNIFFDNVCTDGQSHVIDIRSSNEALVFECNDVYSSEGAEPLYYGVLGDLTGINGNISVDPLFCGDTGSGNYYLQAGSPCAPDNVPAHCSNVLMGCYPVNCIVSTESSSWGKIKNLIKN